MAIRFKKIIVLQIAMLALVSCYSALSSAGNGYRLSTASYSTCPACVYPTQELACKSLIGIGTSGNAHVYRRYSTVNATLGSCIYAPFNNQTSSAEYSHGWGQVSDACDGGSPRNNQYLCGQTCLAGSSYDLGTLADIVNGNPSACRTPSEFCQHRAGTSYQALGMTSAINGCTVSCAVVVGSGAFPINCTYSGATAGPADGPNDENTSPELEPPEEITPAPPNDFCPAGTDEGFVNGARFCAPRTKANGQPNVATVPTSTNVQTEMTTSTSTTTQNPNGSTTVTTVTNTIGGGSSGSGSGNGTGGDSGISRDYANGDYSQWFDTTEVEQSIEALKAEYISKFGEAKNSLSSSMNLAGASGLPSFGPVNVLGKSISFNLAEYSGQLSIIAQAVIFISLVVSAYIVLKR